MRNINSVLPGNLFQKVSSTAKILSISTLAITILLVAFVILSMVAEITTGYLEYRMPYDIMLYNTYRYIDEIDDIPGIDFSFVGNILGEQGILLAEEVSRKSNFVLSSAKKFISFWGMKYYNKAIDNRELKEKFKKLYMPTHRPALHIRNAGSTP